MSNSEFLEDEIKDLFSSDDLIFEANSDNKITEENRYAFDPIIGFQLLKDSSDKKNCYNGKDIINFSKGDLTNPDALLASKQIMREAIDFHLGNKSIKIREYLSVPVSYTHLTLPTKRIV